MRSNILKISTLYLVLSEKVKISPIRSYPDYSPRTEIGSERSAVATALLRIDYESNYMRSLLKQLKESEVGSGGPIFPNEKKWLKRKLRENNEKANAIMMVSSRGEKAYLLANAMSGPLLAGMGAAIAYTMYMWQDITQLFLGIGIAGATASTFGVIMAFKNIVRYAKAYTIRDGARMKTTGQAEQSGF